MALKIWTYHIRFLKQTPKWKVRIRIHIWSLLALGTGADSVRRLLERIMQHPKSIAP